MPRIDFEHEIVSETNNTRDDAYTCMQLFEEDDCESSCTAVACVIHAVHNLRVSLGFPPDETLENGGTDAVEQTSRKRGGGEKMRGDNIKEARLNSDNRTRETVLAQQTTELVEQVATVTVLAIIPSCTFVLAVIALTVQMWRVNRMLKHKKRNAIEREGCRDGADQYVVVPERFTHVAEQQRRESRF
ncbi:hypothetical protein FGB62_91g01 [Gracilaria domingensis]|nr:hypothetical protein FGB62_91g01 [Gracilaria domingensis]